MSCQHVEGGGRWGGNAPSAHMFKRNRRRRNGVVAQERRIRGHLCAFCHTGVNVQQIPQRTSSSSSESYAGGAPDGTGSPTVAIFFFRRESSIFHNIFCRSHKMRARFLNLDKKTQQKVMIRAKMKMKKHKIMSKHKKKK